MPVKANSIPRDSHWTIIRLAAALAILSNHTSHLFWDFDPNSSQIWLISDELRKFWPSVPILFFASGFLVTLSLKNSNNWLDFSLKRILRIYPPLWGAVLVSSCLLLFLGQVNMTDDFIFYVIAQSTLLQTWTPEILRDYGVGNPNGSLWIIPIIAQFYLICPMIPRFNAWFENRLGIYGIFAIVILLSAVRIVILNIPENSGLDLLKKIAGITIFPWLLFFYLGNIFVKYFDKISASTTYIIPIFLIYTLSIYIPPYFFDNFYYGNQINPINFLILSIIILKIAYARQFRTTVLQKMEKWFQKNDFTFGIFVYHMIVVNVIVEYKLFNSIQTRVLFFYMFTFLISYLSMKFLERPIQNNRDYIISKLTNFTGLKPAR